MSGTGGDVVSVVGTDNNIDPVWHDYIEQSHLISQPTVTGSGPGAVLKCSSDKFFHANFSTDAVQPSFEISQQISDSVDSLLLGLDGIPAGSDGLSIGDVLSAFDANASSFPPLVGAIITVLRSPIDGVLPKFQIDGSNGSKNGVWLVALNSTSLEIATALTLVMKPLGPGKEVDLGSVQDSLKTTAGLQVDPASLKFSSNLPRLRLKHIAVITKDATGNFSVGSEVEIIVEIPVAGFLINLKVNSDGRLSVGLLNNGGNFASLANLLTNGPAEGEATPSEPGILDNIKLWKVIVKLPHEFEFSGSDIAFEIGFTVTLRLTGQPITIGLSYDTGSKTFSGGLLFQTQFLNRLDPNYDDLEDLPAGMLATLAPFYNLATSSPFNSLPSSVPTLLTEAFITYTKASSDAPYELKFSAAMASVDAVTPPGGGAVPFPFDWSGISLDYYRKGPTATEEAINSLSVSSTFELHSDSGRFLAGQMSVSFDYIEGGGGPSVWSLSGTASNLQLGAIAQFFDADLNGEVLDVLGKLTVDSIDVSYTYQDDAATSFLFSGIITFGDLQLKLYYQYVSADAAANGTSAAQKAKNAGGADNLAPIENTNGQDSSWRFDAYLDAVGGSATIGEIADSIVDNAAESLPGFVRDIQVKPEASDHLIAIHCGKTTSQTSNGAIERAIFTLSVSISSVEFTIEQLSSNVGSGGPSTKRLLRVSAGKLPLLDNLPVVKELPQPWQKLQYMWSPALGLTRDEVAALNSQLLLDGSDNKLYFKPATRDDADETSTNDPVVLVEGHHFIVVHNDEAILDHVFGSKDDSPPDSGGTGNSAPSDPPEKPPSKGAMKLNTGILDITAVSLQYKKGRVYIFIDATLALGPLALSLIGLGIGFKVSGLQLNDLSTLLTLVDGIDFQLNGMEVVFDNPPILIAGCFYREVTQNGDQLIRAYRGGIAVAIPPYTFVAVGEYAVVTTPSGEFKSVFIFAKLDGPIIDFQFAILKGLRIGFGYNSSVRSPAVEELAQFPLIDNGAVSGAGNHPMAILEKMQGGPNPFVQLKQDNYWLAFGFTVSSFDLINATVVALVQFGNAGSIFSLFGDLNISYPPDSPPDVKLFNIEILMKAELNFIDDVFKLEAALAPTSFILVPYCRLLGGLALYTFFGSSPHAGDWVLSVGGYHRLFDVPAWYPRPARIGLDFNVGIIHIRGEGYFAITPKAIMTGCMIRCELHIGPVYAWLDAAFDAMVQFSPLHYWVSMHVEVGVECNVPALFCTIHIRISIGAGLEIQGPEFGGTAYVDFWFFSFSFDFGAKVEGPPPINLLEFYSLCEKNGPPDNSPNNTATEGLNVRIKMSLEDGAFSMPSEDKATTAPPDDTGAGTKWYVKGGNFQFRVSSVFAITQSYIETEDSSDRQQDGTTTLLENQDTSKMQQVQPPPSLSKLSSLPMQLVANLANPDGDGISSKFCIAIQDVDDKGLSMEGFKPSFIIKAMPQTLWSDRPPDRLTQAKGTIDLPMAVTFSAPDPVLAVSKIPQFNATDMAKECAGANKVPQLPAVTQQDLLPEPLPTTTSPTPTEKWASMTETWEACSTSNLSLANELTQLIMTTLGWDKPPPDVVEKAAAAGLEPWKLPVSFPSRLVSGTGREAQDIEDGLDSFYLELPRITVAPVH